jgi:glycosyltransferase involved in cell wall biosynthesis
MVKVCIIYGSWLTALIGPSKSLTRFSKNKEFFLKNEIDLNIFSFDKFISRNFSHEVKAKETKTNKGRLKKTFFKFSKSIFLFSKLEILLKYFKPGKQIVKLFKRNNSIDNYDVFVFHELYTCYYFLKSYPNLNGKKVILYHHGNGEGFTMLKLYYPLINESGFLRKLFEIEKYVLSRIDKFMFISNNSRLRFLKRFDSFKVETDFFHNGIENIEGYSNNLKDYSKFKLVCAGTINYRKGQELIIDAIPKIRKDIIDRLHITFLGNGPDLIKLKDKVEKLGLLSVVDFRGGTNNVREYLLSSNIFILTSRDEGLPIAIIEAMREGLPIISTNVAGIPELVENEYNGLLIEPTVDSVVNSLNSLSEKDWQSFGNNSRLLFEEKFTLEKMMENYANAIKTV